MHQAVRATLHLMSTTRWVCPSRSKCYLHRRALSPCRSPPAPSPQARFGSPSACELLPLPAGCCQLLGVGSALAVSGENSAAEHAGSARPASPSLPEPAPAARTVSNYPPACFPTPPPPPHPRYGTIRASGTYFLDSPHGQEAVTALFGVAAFGFMVGHSAGAGWQGLLQQGRVQPWRGPGCAAGCREASRT